ncbi:META domain-containing protein [Dysgonomonas sp. ZJ279]|uniref:META domain-containing protein n=1 Tax=Dysgonomonas sp. ZJ279 TaxID=2709796 RepID=UPI0013EA4B3A|nr:META domain-containing protein [Dysgonomonas sp. ZJ279]
MKHLLKSVTLVVTAVALSFGIQSCSSTKPIEKNNLAGYWVLKTLNGTEATTAFEGPIPSIEFNFTDSLIAGSAGCNRYFGGFTLNEKNEFAAPQLGSTMMMCFQKNAEPEFLKALGTPNLVLVLNKDGVLQFTEGEKVLLQFEKGEMAKENSGVQPVSLDNLAGSWTLSSFTGEDLATLFSDRKPTMEISADGKIFGFAGCNTYRTNFTLTENTVAFGPVMSTKMACPSLQGEDKFTSALATPLQATINGNTLTFLKDGNVVFEFSKTEDAVVNSLDTTPIE